MVQCMKSLQRGSASAAFPYKEGPGDAREASNSYLIEMAEVYYQVHGIATPSVHIIPWAT